jgi:FAD/FMN-containing dehydrogenase
VDDMPAVLKLFHAARRGPFTLMAFECMDRPCFDLTIGHTAIKAPLETKSGAYVLMEVDTPKSEGARAGLDKWLESLFEQELVLDGTIAQSPREARELWKIREDLPEVLFMSGTLHKNDIALPISQLDHFVDEMVALFKKVDPEFRLFVFGHIGDGNLHVNTMKPEAMEKELFLKKCHAADEHLFTLVQKYHGSVSAEHGIGLLKKDALRFSRTPAEMVIFRALKKSLDPAGLLNPGKIFD